MQGGWPQGLTWLDGVWALIIVLLLLRGFLRGFFQEVMELVGFGAAIYAALQVYPALSTWVAERMPGLPPEAARAGSFGVVAALILALVAALTGMVTHLVRLSPLSWVDTLAGAVLGAVKGVGVVALIVTVLSALPPGDLRDVLNDSRISRELKAALPPAWEELRRALPGLPSPLPGLSPGPEVGPERWRTPPGGNPFI